MFVCTLLVPMIISCQTRPPTRPSPVPLHSPSESAAEIGLASISRSLRAGCCHLAWGRRSPQPVGGGASTRGGVTADLRETLRSGNLGEGRGRKRTS